MCNPIIQFELINPVTNKRKPRYEVTRNIFRFPVETKYRYYIEAKKLDTETGIYNFYLLLSTNKFSEHCRLCETDMYNNCKIHPRGEFKEFVMQECAERGNIEMNKVDANDEYDIWQLE